MIASDSALASPIKTIRVRRRVETKSVSYKTIKIAKRVKRASGLPQPLSCEEDFVIELKGAPSDFLKPFSGYYELPEVRTTRELTACNGVNPRDVVGPFKDFQKHWSSSNDNRVKDLLKRNKALMAFTGQAINSFDNIFVKRGQMPVTMTERLKNKAEDMHERQKMYWDKINKNLNRQATIKTRIKRKITSIMNTPI